ncbi:MAG: tetratricopeptide repeat protein, partial [Gemmatimonadetes bacterium]|nr:tetratricopeptide repeat protein [Gemmatimonadota bacterium]
MSYSGGSRSDWAAGLHRAVSRLQVLIRELRRRHVFHAAATYGAAIFVIIQAADLIFPVLGLPQWTYTLTVLLCLGGAPVVLALAWAYDITAMGVRRTEPLETTPSAPELQPAAAPPRSLAVLPFANLSGDPENEYFSDGVTEDIIARVSMIPGLKVISRASVMQFKETRKSSREIARMLGAAKLLEGSVRRSAARVRIVAELVDAESDTHLWAETYDRDMEDIFAIQTDVANRIASALETTVSTEDRARLSRRPTENLEAYDLYLRGLYAWNRRTEDALRESVTLLTRALALDAQFGLAWATLADAYVILGVYGAAPPREVMPQARAAAERALAIEPSRGEALTALACVRAVYDWDFGAAERDFAQALARNPQHATAFQWLSLNVLVPQGSFQRAGEALTRALQLDPLSPAIRTSEAVLAYYARDYGRAVEACERVLLDHPRFTLAHYFRGLSAVERGGTAVALDSLREALELSPTNPEAMAALGYAYARAGRTQAARGIADELAAQAAQRYTSPSMTAQVHSALGEPERALDLLKQAAELRTADLIWL